MLPVLWSFRRCPYAMRARLAIQSSGVRVAVREIVLRSKPQIFLDVSPKGTVPVLQTEGRVIEESRDIMIWALSRNDPEGWLDVSDDAQRLIDICDGPFKQALDRTKYAVRYPGVDEEDERAKAFAFLRELNDRLSDTPFLMGAKRTFADVAILPFVRQFANTDRVWFEAQGLLPLTGWLDQFLASDRFALIMTKYTPWQAGKDEVLFP